MLDLAVSRSKEKENRGSLSYLGRIASVLTHDPHTMNTRRPEKRLDSDVREFLEFHPSHVIHDFWGEEKKKRKKQEKKIN